MFAEILLIPLCSQHRNSKNVTKVKHKICRTDCTRSGSPPNSKKARSITTATNSKNNSLFSFVRVDNNIFHQTGCNEHGNEQERRQRHPLRDGVGHHGHSVRERPSSPGCQHPRKVNRLKLHSHRRFVVANTPATG